MNEDVKQVPSDLVVKATAKLQTDIEKELSLPDPVEDDAIGRLYKKSDKDRDKKKKDQGE